MVGGSAVEAAPDVAVFLTDQQQADMMGVCAPVPLDTPAMDTLALQGVRFARAFCATPQCSPARAAMWTGRYPHRTGVVGNVSGKPEVPAGMSGPLDPSIPNIATVFAAAGYETAYFGKWHLGGLPCDYGFQTCSREGLRGSELTSEVIAFLRSRPTKNRRPLLLVVSWTNPHDIYRFSRRGRTLPRSDRPVRLPGSLEDDLRAKPYPQRHFLEVDQGRRVSNFTRRDWENYLRFYYHLIEQVDAEIGRVLAEFRLHSPDSLVVFGSDHGDNGAAHGLPFKCPAMYEELVRVPLVFSWPGHIPRGVSDALVSQVDLLPTLCDLAGVAAPSGVDGRSLRPLLETPGTVPADWRDAVYVEYYGKQNWRVPIRMIRTASWKYVRYLGDGEELYHLADDPAEVHNLVGTLRGRASYRRLSERLDRWMAGTLDPFNRWTVTDRHGRVLRAPAATGSAPW